MKLLFIRFLFLIFCHLGIAAALSQNKMPTLMVIPSDNWCEQRYFMSKTENQGLSIKTPDYKRAFQEDTEIGLVISKIGQLMIDNGFRLKDAEQEIKNLSKISGEDLVTSSTKSNSDISESPLDKIIKQAKADLIIQIWWNLNSDNSISFTLEALDAYTSKRVAVSSGTCKMNENKVMATILENAIKKNLNPFLKQLKDYFSDIQINGREVVIRIKKWDNWDKNLEDEIGGKEVNQIIEEWVSKNSINSTYNLTDANENFMLFEQVRIPTIKDGLPLDARKFLRGLQLELKKEPYLITSKLMIRGLGESILVIGEK